MFFYNDFYLSGITLRDCDDHMANGADIIRSKLWRSFDSIYRAGRSTIIRLSARNDREKALLVSVDDETHALLVKVAAKNKQPIEEIAAVWLSSQAKEYQQANLVKEPWEMLSERGKQVVALCCLGYEDEEIATTLHITNSTVRAHLFRAIGIFRLRKKSDLRFALRDWDFSDYDRHAFE